MRKFLMAAALLAIPAAVSAQSANATINARVWMPLSVTATQGTLDLGLAIQGAGTAGAEHEVIDDQLALAAEQV